jgi:hypothetical protein
MIETAVETALGPAVERDPAAIEEGKICSVRPNCASWPLR